MAELARVLPVGMLVTHSTSTSHTRTNWKQWWLRHSGQPWPALCTFCDGNAATLGAHVEASTRRLPISIAPCCASCNSNSSKRSKRMKVRRATVVIPVTEDECQRIEDRQGECEVTPPANAGPAPAAAAAAAPPTANAEQRAETKTREKEGEEPTTTAADARPPDVPEAELCALITRVRQLSVGRPGTGVCVTCAKPVCSRGKCNGRSLKYCCIHCFCQAAGCRATRDGAAPRQPETVPPPSA